MLRIREWFEGVVKHVWNNFSICIFIWNEIYCREAELFVLNNLLEKPDCGHNSLRIN